ncbi:MAG: hypothetical protein IT581_14935 [Verrucomicrobiales bacterium]|nr:hypothetical protein [Verrucomicrobiales bacterium]
MPPPFVPHSSGSRRYRVTPQERVDAFWNSFCAAGADLPVAVAACRAVRESESLTTLDSTLTIRVSELRYPGERFEEVVDKWLYLIDLRSRSFLAEVEARGQGGTARWTARWLGGDGGGGGRRSPITVSPGRIQLRVGAGGSLSNYGFFLSPVALSAQGRDFLLGRARAGDSDAANRLGEAAVRAKWTSRSEAFAWIPDPFRWAADTSEEYYLPAVDEWQTWVEDASRAAHVFIASTLKAWIDAGDSVNVEGRLRNGQPRQWLEQYRRDELSRRRAAESAAAYLAHCVTSPEHRAVEISAIEAGGTSLSIAYQMWGLVWRRLSATEPGRRLSLQLARDDQRIPRLQIFSDAAVPFTSWNDYRYAWLAAVAVFVEAVPALARLLDPGTAAQQLRRHLERLGIPTLRGAYRRIYENLAAGRDPVHGATPREIRRNRITLTRLTERARAAGDLRPPTRVGEIAQSVDRLHANYVQPWERHICGIGVVIEVVNVSLAIRDLAQASEDQTSRRVVSLVGSVADLTTVILGLSERMAAEGYRTTLRGAGGAAAVVGGICQMLDMEQSIVDSASQNDFGQAAGYAIAAVGAGMTAAGGGMILAAALGGGATLGPLGAIVGAVGAGLILVGTLVAALLRSSEYQLFAQGCFLGDGHDRDTAYPEWAQAGFPTSSALQEARVLLGLMAAFRVQRLGSGSPWPTAGNGAPESHIEITFGNLSANAVIRIRMEQRYGSRTITARFHLVVSTDQAVYDGGDFMPRLGELRMTRDDDLHLRSLRLPLQPLSVTLPGGREAVLFGQFPGASGPDSSRVQVRVEFPGSPSIVVPPRGYLEISTMEAEEVNSFHVDHYTADS